jgi:protein SCO1/2
MADTPQPIPRTLWLGMSLVMGLLGLAYILSLAEMERQHKRAALPVLGKIADFALTNQNNQPVTLAALTNHVWVADIIFTRCAGPCPVMTGHMKQLQDALPPASMAKLVTLTTDPEFDSPTILKRYAAHFGADDQRWTFLTGTKLEIANLGSGSLKLGSTPIKLEDQKTVADLFIHTTIFVLVDKHTRLRGVFETGGDDVNWTNVQPRLLTAINQLEREP